MKHNLEPEGDGLAVKLALKSGEEFLDIALAPNFLTAVRAFEIEEGGRDLLAEIKY